MMYANIFKKSILRIENQEDLDFVLSLEHAKIEITDSLIRAINTLGEEFYFEIVKVEDEIFTSTYEGLFPSGNVFRLVKPKEIALINAKENFGSESAEDGFTLAGKDSRGWAISFYLTPAKPVLRYEVDHAEKTDSLKNHIETFNIAIEHSPEHALGISQKLLDLICNDPFMLYRANDIDGIITFMKHNINHYTIRERSIIDQL